MVMVIDGYSNLILVNSQQKKEHKVLAGKLNISNYTHRYTN
jgi:hypothetical protein